MALQDDYIKTALRLPRDLHKRVQESADAKARSMNAEIIDRIAASFEQPDIPALRLAGKFGVGGESFVEEVAAAVSELVLKKIDERMSPFVDVIEDEDGAILELRGPALHQLLGKAQRKGITLEEVIREMMLADESPEMLELTKHRTPKDKPE